MVPGLCFPALFSLCLSSLCSLCLCGESSSKPYPLHAVVLAVDHVDAPLAVPELRDVEKAVGVLHRVADVAELSRLRTRLAADGFQELAVRRVDAEAMVVRIADEQVAVAGDAEATGPAVAEIGRHPGGAE